MGAADYIDVQRARPHWIAGVESRLHGYDALLMPTVPITAPPIADLRDSDDIYFAANGLILRNPTYIHFLDGCALSQIGRASWRERVCQYVEIPVAAGSLKKKK